MLVGVLLFNEWYGNMYWIGFVFVIVLIVGVVLIFLIDKIDLNCSVFENWGVGICVLILLMIGYVGYMIVVYYGNVNV